ncbi:glycosyltransferase family 2 protein [Candidatus Uhrbacteria bacterium]|nr:glycosyltransferase family 2 protein [Candidatus Uhrbacteria bacterium]
MSRVTISLVTYNSAAHIKECLQSLQGQTYSDAELVVLDNASSDGTVAIVGSEMPSCKMILESHNTGFAAGHNKVIEQCRSDYILVLNDDCVLENDYIEKLVKYMDTHPDAGSATGVLYRVSSLTGKKKCDIVDTLGLCINYSFHVKNIGSGAVEVDHSFEAFPIFGVSATAAVYRRQALEQCAIISLQPQDRQYFDEQFFIYKEDVDLAARLYRYGWNAYCLSGATGYHVRSTSMHAYKRNTAWINQISYRNHLWFVCKNIAPIDGIRTYFGVLMYEAAKFFYLLFCEPRTLGVLPEFFRGLGTIMEKRRAFFTAIPSPRPLLFLHCH